MAVGDHECPPLTHGSKAYMEIRGSNRPETPDLDDLAVIPFGYAVEPSPFSRSSASGYRPTPRDDEPMGVHPMRRMTSRPAAWSDPSMAAQQERVAA